MGKKIQVTGSGRNSTVSVTRDLLYVNYGLVRSYGPCPQYNQQKINTGGSSMEALLGPDLGDGRMRGTATNSNSLQPTMGLLNSHGQGKSWIAGHLLNADLGGRGDEDRNLTPLTSAANAAHKTFEGHIKKILTKCRLIDEASDGPGLPYWYGVLYKIDVSNLTYAEKPAVDDLYSYCYSHMTVSYRLVALPKSDLTGKKYEEIGSGDTKAAGIVTSIGAPNWSPCANIESYRAGAKPLEFSVEIHNEG